MTEQSPAPDPAATLRSRQVLGLLVLVSIVGVVAALAAWCFLELIHEAQNGVYDELPKVLGFDSAPIWWSLPVLFVAGLLAAFAIARLPGNGGHVPADGLNPNPVRPIELPGVLLAAGAAIAFGVVLGPEAPLIALGGGLGALAIGILRSDAPPDLVALVSACGTFAAVSYLFGSPIIAAVLLIEATGIGGKKLPVLLIPGLLAAGIGTLVSIGLGAWTGVDSSDISLSLLQLSEYPRPDVVDFLWTVPLAAAIAVGVVLIFKLARKTQGFVGTRPLALPLVGLIVGGLAIAFAEITDKGVDQVLFSGEEALSPWSRTPTRGRCPRWLCCSSSRASPTPCRSAASAAARCSRRCS